MSPLVWDLAHIGNYEELWLLRDLGGRAADRPALRRHLRRLPAPAPRPPGAADPRPGARRAPTSPSVRDRVLDGLDRSRPRPATTDRPAARRTASSTAWSSSTSTSTTRRCSPRIQLMDDAAFPAAIAGPAPARSPRAAPASAPAEVVRARRAVRDGHRRPSRGPTTTSGPRTRSSCAPFRIDTHAGHQRRVPSRSSTTAATTTRGWWTEAGWAWRQEAGARRTRSSGSARATAAGRCCASARLDLDGAAATSRCSTCAGTRPTPTPAGPASACRPRPSGRRRRRGRPDGGKRRCPWGDADPDRARQPRRSAGAGPRRRRLARRRQPVGRRSR